MTQKRLYYIDAQKILKKINKTISSDVQGTKFFKEDNSKMIENILQSQGINEQNALENEKKLKEKKKLIKNKNKV